jgi:CheY-like chemotaxis protein/HPt (histidine-containing phosphotransfer) domain-containing protein
MLLVDDLDINRSVIGRSLESEGVVVRAVSSGAQALEWLERQGAAQPPCDLILLDAVMPEMNGFELAQRIAGLPGCKSIPMVMLSSSGVRSDAERARAAGIAAYVTKPVSRPELQMALARVMNLRTELPKLPQPAASLPQAQRALDVLLVEDNAINQKLAIALLERWGHTITVAENGAIAVEMVASHAYDLVLMDMMMPVMDGLEATQLIRAMPAPAATVPIIAMTANAMESDRERCLAAGMNDYISKPIKAQELQDLLQKVGQSSMAASGNPATADPSQPDELRDFAFDYGAGLRDMDQEILEIIGQAFLDQWPHDLQKIREKLLVAEAMPVFHTAHALKATLAMFGAEPASELAARMEVLAGRGDLAAAGLLLAPFVAEVNCLRDALAQSLTA